jgi:hypothetical protein
MESGSRHQCLVYEGAPSRYLPLVARVLREKLEQNYRCLYLNSPPMVAGAASTVAALGVDVADAVAKGSLVLTSEQHHLRDGQFDVDAMIRMLEDALMQARRDGYAGLWATGDMTWEFGPERDFSKLLEYERRLEEMFRVHPELGGICQYHADTLPRETVLQGLSAHPGLFISETLSLVNPSYVRPGVLANGAMQRAELESLLGVLCQLGENAS